MKNIFTLFIFSLIISLNSSFAITPLESGLREIRDEYRHNPEEGQKKIKKLWKDFPDVNGRLRTFLDLESYYRKHSLQQLIIEQGTWLLKKDISSIQSKLCVLDYMASAFDAIGNTKKAIEYYEKEFQVYFKSHGKNPENISRGDFIKYAVQGLSMWGKWAINCSLVYARAGKFSDAYTILDSAKSVTSEDEINQSISNIYLAKTHIRILGLMEGKSKEAREKLKSLNDGKTILDIEPDTTNTWEEQLCLKDDDYKLLIILYLNTIIENPPMDLITYKKIIYNARDNVYILSKLNRLFSNPEFCGVFENELRERLKDNQLPHLNLLMAEYYLFKKDYTQAASYYNSVLKNKSGQRYFWPKYYPELNLNENYQSPHRVHLWITCFERAKEQLEKIKK